MTGLADILPLILAGLVALAGGGLWFGGRAKGKAEGERDAAVREKRAYTDAIKRMQDADTGSGDADTDRDWLRRRGSE